MRNLRKPAQLELALTTWGGRREGAGRRREHARPSVPHVPRMPVRAWNPVLVTMRMQPDVPSLRARPAWVAIVRVLRAHREASSVAFVHFSVMTNHLHAIVECADQASLARGMQSFATRLGRALNRSFARRGTVFAGRYHARELTTPTEVRNALRYVLLNARHHAHERGQTLPQAWIDPRSSAAVFDGWSRPLDLRERAADFGTSAPRSWLLRAGWRTRGLLDLDDTPGTRSELARAA